MPRGRRIVAYAGLVVLGSATALFGLDWYLGKYVFAPIRVADCTVPLTAKTVILSPRCKGEMSHPDYGQLPYETNSLGMRDREYDDSLYLKDAPTSKVLAIGDSMTFGAGVAADEIFHSIVEDRDGIIFFNAGFSSLGIEEEEEVVHHLLRKTNPDLVLVSIATNDIVQLNVEGQAAGLASSRIKRLGTLWRVVKDYILPQRLILLLRGVVSDEWMRVYQAKLDVRLEERYEKFARVIGRIHDVLASENPPIPLAVLVIPQVEQVNGFLVGRAGISPTAPSDHLKRRLAGTGVAVLDSVPYFQAKQNAAQLFFPRDRHLTAEGNRVLAEFLERNLDELEKMMAARRPDATAIARR